MSKKQKPEIRLLSEEEEKHLMQIAETAPDLTTLGITSAKMTGLRIGKLCALQ